MICYPNAPLKMTRHAHVEQVSLQGCLPNLILQTPSELDRLTLGMMSAQKAYKHAVLFGHEEGPFLVADNISMATFEQWCATLDSCWKVCFLHHGKKMGVVVLYGDPTKLHATVATWFNDKLVLQVGDPWTELVQSLGDAGHQLAHGVKQPDASYTSGSAGPRVTLEVAYRNEDLSKLMKEVSDWHAAGVVLSIGIKIQAKELGKGNDKQLHIALYWVQQSIWDRKPEVIEFSPGVCMQENRGNFVMGFPFSYISADVPCSEDFILKVDLLALQKHIMKQLSLEAEENQKMLYHDNSGQLRCGDIAPCKACKLMHGEKVRCDHPDCGGWFHLACVGLKGDEKLAPLWFCPACFKKSEKTSKWTKF